MSEPGPTVTVRLRGRPVTVAVRETEERTRLAAERVDQHLERVERRSARIDTVGFAFETALHFAEDALALEAHLRELNAQHEAERRDTEREIAAALEKLHERLNRVVLELTPDETA